MLIFLPKLKKTAKDKTVRGLKQIIIQLHFVEYK